MFYAVYSTSTYQPTPVTIASFNWKHIRIICELSNDSGNYSGIFLVPPAAAGEEKGKEASPESPPGFLAVALRPRAAIAPDMPGACQQ
jgi:hypothetical protein